MVIQGRSLDLPGNLVAIEGMNGTGKTTLVRRLAAEPKRDGQEVLVTKFPSRPVRRSWIQRRFAADGRAGQVDLFSALAVHTEAMADRLRQSRDVITPAPTAGKTVIVEKYLLGIAAALENYGMPSGWFEELVQQLWHPTAWIVLTAPAEVCLARVRHGRTTRMPEQRHVNWPHFSGPWSFWRSGTICSSLTPPFDQWRNA